MFTPRHDLEIPSSADEDDYDPAIDGRLDPNTAALMDGAPPGGVGGRSQPTGPAEQDGEHGPSENEVQNLPG